MAYNGSLIITFTELAVDVFDGAYSVSVNRQTASNGSAYEKGWCTAQGKPLRSCHNLTGCETP
jgi:hypothetical protein